MMNSITENGIGLIVYGKLSWNCKSVGSIWLYNTEKKEILCMSIQHEPMFLWKWILKAQLEDPGLIMESSRLESTKIT